MLVSGTRNVESDGTLLTVVHAMTTIGYTSHSAERYLQSLRDLQKDETATVLGSPEYSINFRTLGDVAYFMCSLNSDNSLLRSVEDRIWSAFKASQA